MSKQNVTDKILSDAKEEAQSILDKHKNEAQQIKDRYEKQCIEKRKAIENKAEEVKKSEMVRAVSQKRLEFNREIVKEKQKLINAIIAEALKTLKSHKKYPEFLRQLIEKSGIKKGTLTINQEDWKHHGSNLKKFIKDKGLEYEIENKASIKGGIMIQWEKTTYHGSLDIIGELLSDELTIAVSKILF
jgi:vacuolar-type H+-ATPase subunit E/Vma4